MTNLTFRRPIPPGWPRGPAAERSHFQLSRRRATRPPRRSGVGGAACAERGNVIGTKTKTGGAVAGARPARPPPDSVTPKGGSRPRPRGPPEVARTKETVGGTGGARLTRERHGGLVKGEEEKKRELQYGCLAYRSGAEQQYPCIRTRAHIKSETYERAHTCTQTFRARARTHAYPETHIHANSRHTNTKCKEAPTHAIYPDDAIAPAARRGRGVAVKILPPRGRFEKRDRATAAANRSAIGRGRGAAGPSRGSADSQPCDAARARACMCDKPTRTAGCTRFCVRRSSRSERADGLIQALRALTRHSLTLRRANATAEEERRVPRDITVDADGTSSTITCASLARRTDGTCTEMSEAGCSARRRVVASPRRE